MPLSGSEKESSQLPNVYLSGWILDLYPSPQGMTLWLIEANQKRHRLTDRFTPAFYVRGLPESIKRLEQALQKFTANVACRFTERRDLWENRAVPVLEVTVAHPTQFSSWMRWNSDGRKGSSATDRRSE
jgi:hypothetical protein